MTDPVYEALMPSVAVLSILCVAYILTNPFSTYKPLPDGSSA